MIDYQTRRIGPDESILVVDVSGRLNEDTSEFFFGCLEGVIEEGDTKILLDCSGLEFVSSLGIGTLVRIQSRLKRQGGTVKLAAVQGVVAEVLRVVHLDKLLQMYDTVDDAAASFAAA